MVIRRHGKEPTDLEATHPDLINAQQHGADEQAQRDSPEAEGPDHGEWQGTHPDEQEAGRVAGVCQRQGRLEDTLTHAQHVLEHSHVVVHQAALNGVTGCLQRQQHKRCYLSSLWGHNVNEESRRQSL